MVWIKGRSHGTFHILQDSVRTAGNGKSLYTNVTSSEGTYDADGYISSLDANGFTVAGGVQTIGSGRTYAAWCWKAGGTVSANNNSNGDITSTVSANQDAGFSIVSFTKTNGNAETIGHGLGAIPELIIMKTTGSSGGDWQVYAAPIGNTKRLNLNLTAAQSTSGIWNNTTPTDEVFTTTFNPSTTIIAYCFHSVDGYQKIGSFTGNGSTNGPIVTTGFRPRFLMWKATSTTGNWNIVDSIRSPLVDKRNYLYADLSQGEDVTSYDIVDFNDDSFQMKQQYTNKSGHTYIYLAIA